MYSSNDDTCAVPLQWSKEDLQEIAKLEENLTNDDNIKLYLTSRILICEAERLTPAIQLAKKWAAEIPDDHPDHYQRTSIMKAVTAWQRQLKNVTLSASELKDVQEALSYVLLRTFKWGLEAMSCKRTDIPALVHWANLAETRIQLLSRLEDINEAIRNLEIIIKEMGDHAHRDFFLVHLGKFLNERSTLTASMADVAQAIAYVTEAMARMPHDGPSYANALCILGNIYSTRYGQTQSIHDLNQAIDASSRAIKSTPPDVPCYAKNLGFLSNLLYVRYKRLESRDDLGRAIRLLEKAVEVSSEDPTYLAKLAEMLCTRSSRRAMTSAGFLIRAMDIAKKALDATHHDDPRYAKHAKILSGVYVEYFERTGFEKIDYLDQAESLLNKALHASHSGDDTRRSYLSRRANISSLRFEKTGVIDHNDQAINLLNNLQATTPRHHFSRTAKLVAMGDLLGARYKMTGLQDDLQRQLSSYLEGWQFKNGRPQDRIIAASNAATILIDQKRWKECNELLRAAVLFLPRLNLRTLSRTDVQKQLSYSAGLASKAAAVALNAGKAPGEALQLLELGRGVLSGLMMDMRGDITDLKSKNPELADKFISLRNLLDSSGSSHQWVSELSVFDIASRELSLIQQREADREFDATIEQIRADPEFSTFLLPPPIEELKKAAAYGPVIMINKTSIRNDAFIIKTDSITLVELQYTSEEEEKSQLVNLQNRSNLSSLLEWLWHTICHPILNALGHTKPISNGDWPHVWWIPTGTISQMPLHAAGIYHKRSTDTVLDRVISSYTPSIRALIHGRKNKSQKTIASCLENSCALMVAMQTTPNQPGEGYLPYANSEVEILNKLCVQLDLKSIIPLPKREEILSILPTCQIFHFAGHGQVDYWDPTQSCLLLEDWESNPLTVGEIRACRLQDNAPYLAFLSACSTGVNKDQRLVDEGVNLINGFQLAGFQHVVGTLWEVSDKHCVDVAKILYETLRDEGMTEMAVSRGLHRALRRLRNGGNDVDKWRDVKLIKDSDTASLQRTTNFHWVPYVHFGI